LNHRSFVRWSNKPTSTGSFLIHGYDPPAILSRSIALSPLPVSPSPSLSLSFSLSLFVSLSLSLSLSLPYSLLSVCLSLCLSLSLNINYLHHVYVKCLPPPHIFCGTYVTWNAEDLAQIFCSINWTPYNCICRGWVQDYDILFFTILCNQFV